MQPRVQPSLFLAHGNPMHALADNAYTRSWQALLADARPQAVLCISAHWETPGIALSVDEQPPTLHDFGGFPPALHAVQYPCPGSPALAERVARLLPDWAGPVQGVRGRGLDHGAWCLLRHLFPQADVPVVQMSLALNQSPAWHLAVAESLRPLREEGVLILASGNIVHNLRRWFSGEVDTAWAQAFDRHISQAIEQGDADAVLRYAEHPHACEAVPTPEHFLPLLYALGASRPQDAITQTAFPPDTLENLCMRSIRWA